MLSCLQRFLLLRAPCAAVHLSPAARAAFDEYIAGVEKRLVRQHSSPETFIAALDRDQTNADATERDLRSGTVGTQAINGGSWPVSGGLMHHWRAAAFVHGATRDDMLALLDDYNHLSSYYRPDVVSSRVIGKEGAVVTLAMRLKKQVAVTVVFDAEYRVQAGLIATNRGYGGGYGYSRSAHIWQVDAPDTPHEHRRREGDDDGFLWRMNAYWSFLQVRDGLIIECEAISLTREVPPGLGWLVTPILKEFPRTSLESTLIATRNALSSRAHRAHEKEQR